MLVDGAAPLSFGAEQVLAGLDRIVEDRAVTPAWWLLALREADRGLAEQVAGEHDLPTSETAAVSPAPQDTTPTGAGGVEPPVATVAEPAGGTRGPAPLPVARVDDHAAVVERAAIGDIASSDPTSRARELVVHGAEWGAWARDQLIAAPSARARHEGHGVVTPPPDVISEQDPQPGPVRERSSSSGSRTTNPGSPAHDRIARRARSWRRTPRTAPPTRTQRRDRPRAADDEVTARWGSSMRPTPTDRGGIVTIAQRSRWSRASPGSTGWG